MADLTKGVKTGGRDERVKPKYLKTSDRIRIELIKESF